MADASEATALDFERHEAALSVKLGCRLEKELHQPSVTLCFIPFDSHIS